ncbi:MAG: hypothetical protein CMO01_21650 [Thalassobius sp.]|nr:hypothetical protein [Thalassovita sp.]
MVQNKKVLLEESYVTIVHDLEDNIVYNYWKGFLKPEMIIETAQRFMVMYKDIKCSKIYNDNSQISGPWNGASEWVKDVYFPYMIENGLKHFAWILSPSIFSEVSARQAMMETDIIKPFKDHDKAIEWLREVEELV